MQTVAVFVALLGLSAVSVASASKYSPGTCHCDCCAPVDGGEKECTAPVGSLHSQTKTDVCLAVFCTEGDTLGAQKQAFSNFCSSKCFPDTAVPTTCRPKDCTDQGVNVHCE
ncbi:unnamed protein product [Prorocentrum cordatum]|uniref:Uncharacterized protein n=1 Tax=Prorocentrum cordatum TaxID=2364126 RepID=A0ABN9W8I3_9DINO|nr:unnamed protein product [Polarella glacialis]CAK0882515.1 unnamed protein product [Polarella glacialis]|mmetsp:Transcript_15967/g.42283  ORF Transcript_15967/g.42283 Transcript_15967/m.42283 type:complete len:112 (-) Transcript_15967:138-473(-)